MFKRALKYIAITAAILCFGIYFIYASNLTKRGEESEICSNIEVTVADSAKYGFVRASDIRQYLIESPNNYFGSRRANIDLYLLEQEVNKFNAIKESSASIDRLGVMRVTVSQRKPMLRMQTPKGALYADETGYLFSPTYSFAAYVPIITGEIPIVYSDDINTLMSDTEREWIGNIIGLVSYIEADPFLSTLIQQIDIEKGGNIALYPKVGDHKITLGQPYNLYSKFERLMAFYKHVVPNRGVDLYSEIDISFNEQIVCKKRNKK